VTDDGPGVDPAERTRIFARFERGQAGQGRPGFGLGLPIARELAQRMGGDVLLLDTNAGAAFEVRLPCLDVPSAAPRAHAESAPVQGPGSPRRLRLD